MENKEVKQEEKRTMEVKRAVVVAGGGSGITPKFLEALQRTTTKYDGAFKDLAKK